MKIRFLLACLLLSFSTSLYSQFNSQENMVPYLEKPVDIEAGDLDGDGDNDILTVHEGLNNELIWYENENAQGRFLPKKIISNLNQTPKDISLVDLDGDLDLDIVIAQTESEHLITWFQNDGTGNFSNEILILNSDQAILSITTNDLNGDGSVDIIAGLSSGNSVIWLENDGSGDFGTENFLSSTGVNVNGVHTGDINDDTFPDIIYCSQGNNSVAWFQNDGSGNFGSEQLISDVIMNAGSVELSDINGDGDLDILTTSIEDEDMFWFENQGSGTFLSTGVKIGISPNHHGLNSAQTIDVDGDGNLDIVTTSYDVDNNFPYSRVYKNITGSGVFSTGPVFISEYFNLNHLALADFDNDNVIDFAFTCALSYRGLYWFKNTSTISSISYSDEHPIDLLIREPRATSVVDIDNDGDNDFTVAYGNGQHTDAFLWYENLGQESYVINVISPVGDSDNFDDCLPVDIDGDGDIDLLTTEAFGDFFLFKNTDGNGNFEKVEIYASFDVKHIDVGDVDGDGDMDIVGTNTGSGDKLFWFENPDGIGTFDYGEVIASGVIGQYQNVFLRDMDNDGNLDIVALSDSSVDWYRNEDGQGTFSGKINISNVGGFSNIAVTDVDNDLDEDIIYGKYQSFDSDSLNWIANDGTGEFGSSIFIDIIDGGITELTSKDFDNDGDGDIMFINFESEKCVFYLNLDGGGDFGQATELDGTYPDYTKIKFGDLDNDGDDDLIFEYFNSFPDVNIYVKHENVSTSTTISGTVFLDENENGILDNNEIGLFNQPVSIDPNPTISWSSNIGEFNFFVSPDTYYLSCSPQTGWGFSTDQFVNIDIIDSPVTQNFGLIPTTTINTAEIDVSSAATRCGFVVPFWINYENTGTVLADGKVTFTLDPLSTFVSSDPMPSQINGNELTWDFEKLNPTYSDQIDLKLEIADASNIGSAISFTGKVELLDDSGNIVDTHINTLESVINCAYDPNDKLVEPYFENFDNYTLLNDSLKYTIRFQNTGTDTAFNIRVEDVLDPNLDWGTFEVIASSHDYEVVLKENGKVIFYFNNILLPDSTTNLIESNGFVKYQIKPLDGISDATNIYNSAAIFFDFNAPIFTNQTENIMVDQYPIFSNTIDPKCFGDETGSIELTFPIGDYIYEWSNGEMTSSISNVEAGDYTLTVTDLDGNIVAGEIFSIEEPGLIDITGTIVHTIDDNMIGEISTVVTGGTPPYTYAWNTQPIQTTANIDSLNAGVYILNVLDANDCSFTIEFTVDQMTDINNLAKEKWDFSIKPNPSDGIVNVDLSLGFNIDWSMNIINSIGEIYYSTNSDLQDNINGIITVEEIPSGIYFVVVKSENKVITKKLIVHN